MKSQMLMRAAMTLGLTLLLPLVGALLAGDSVMSYLEIPPEGQKRNYPDFQWAAFIGIWLLFFGLLGVWLVRAKPAHDVNQPKAGRAFPRWGWIGVTLVALFWILAWMPTSVEWLRRYSFPPLWMGFIITINALLHQRTGRCPLARETGFFLALFPASAAFWWLFEYLNRFVDNWIYLDAGDIGSTEYLVHASLCFATVLPAVYSVRLWLGSFPRLQSRFLAGPELKMRAPYLSGSIGLAFFAFSLTAIGFAPELFFPFLWVGPLGIWICLELMTDHRLPWPEISHGDWREFCFWALAALLCGFFWELWNFYAMPKWEYQIPFFEAFYLFEMPISGYLGYLLFGLECGITVFCLKIITRRQRLSSIE
ncbi:hypothetical protein DDZ13_08555 [Coraliomargarita sinensis]|uniref:Uncharacterized protein n=1 Tax=Coraliomargarita sinensis TaxID=2174842 RepID=A0A317ZJW0_9BACT|nr:hypothetical protein [Coraliomargarita sinensis]PXA04079.1 hypothetical protein DDZ13_08555 [Coraliomargarita sinensis]